MPPKRPVLIGTSSGGIEALSTITKGLPKQFPADRHVLAEPSMLRPTRGARENRRRPAIAPLFRPAGQVFGGQALATHERSKAVRKVAIAPQPGDGQTLTDAEPARDQ